MKNVEIVKDAILHDLTRRMNQSGVMFRIFGRAKTMRSLRHKMDIKGEKYRSGKGKIQDVIGIRVVLYFTEDIDALEMYLCSQNLVDRSVDTPDVSTFRPQRLNLVKTIPEDLVETFRSGLPEEYAPYIDDTYEIQIRTVFSEGWHEVEHDMRYKCQSDWEDCESYSRQLNGIIATLETAQWSMGAIFREMSQKNLLCGNYRAMLRNQLMLRLADDDFSPEVTAYLNEHPDVVKRLHETDRVVFVFSMLNHEKNIPLTYDNVLFLVNRFDIMDKGVLMLESSETSRLIDSVIM